MRVNNRRVMQGIVHSDRMEKTITVDVERRFKHSKYGKYIKRTNRFVAHDAEGAARIGDRVEIVETRPLSKTKRWRLLNVLERAPTKEDLKK